MSGGLISELHSSCFVCKEKTLHNLAGYERHDLVKCSNCSFVFIRKIPTQEVLSGYYSVYSYNTEPFLSPVTISSYNKLLDEFEKKRKTNKILDIGCGAGFFLEQCRKRNWEVYGTEYSDSAVQLCRQKKIEAMKGELNSMDFNGKLFDVITSFEVIEHINNPVEETKKILSLLRKGGLFYCTTPNFNSIERLYLKDKYNIIGYPEHLSYYTSKSLEFLLKKQGFKKDKILTTGISITRIRTSAGKSGQPLVSPHSDDERIRRAIAGNLLMKFVKLLTNKILTLFGIGTTLKVYFEKR